MPRASPCRTWPGPTHQRGVRMILHYPRHRFDQHRRGELPDQQRAEVWRCARLAGDTAVHRPVRIAKRDVFQERIERGGRPGEAAGAARRRSTIGRAGRRRHRQAAGTMAAVSPERHLVRRVELAMSTTPAAPPPARPAQGRRPSGRGRAACRPAGSAACMHSPRAQAMRSASRSRIQRWHTGPVHRGCARRRRRSATRQAQRLEAERVHGAERGLTCASVSAGRGLANQRRNLPPRDPVQAVEKTGEEGWS